MYTIFSTYMYLLVHISAYACYMYYITGLLNNIHINIYTMLIKQVYAS